VLGEAFVEFVEDDSRLQIHAPEFVLAASEVIVG
jgi:hypothetical protein